MAQPGSTQERTYEPNGGHLALTELTALERCNVRVITQNIDGLHGDSGLPEERLVEVHGRCGLFKCVSAGCRYAYSESIAGSLQLATAPPAPAPPPTGTDAVAASGSGGAMSPSAATNSSVSACAEAAACSSEATGGLSEAAWAEVAAWSADMAACALETALGSSEAAAGSSEAAAGSSEATAGSSEASATAHRLAEVHGSDAAAGAAATVVGTLPRCPECEAPCPPQVGGLSAGIACTRAVDPHSSPPHAHAHLRMLITAR